MKSVTKFGRWLHEAMRGQGIASQAEFAERAGIPANSITNWVRGYSLPTPENADTIAKTLNVSVARVYEAMGRMRPVGDTDYRDWVEALDAATPAERRQILDYARFVLGRSSSARECPEGPCVERVRS